MKALELLKKYEHNKWVYIDNKDIKEAIKELEDIEKLIESFDKKMPRGDMEFKIEIVDDLNQVVMENFK